MRHCQALGGYLADEDFSFALPDGILGYPIPQLGFLAIIAATIIYRDSLSGGLATLATDPPTRQLAITSDPAHTDGIKWLYLELEHVTGDQAVFADVRHGLGETNPLAGLALRGAA